MVANPTVVIEVLSDSTERYRNVQFDPIENSATPS
jgi:hypothetical protein